MGRKNHFKPCNYLAIDRPDFKLSVETMSVIVDEKNRRVITTVHWHLNTPRPFSYLNEILWNKLGTYGMAKGVAVCDEGDTFDVEVGKKISAARAEANAYNNASELVEGRLARLGTMLNTLNAYGNAFCGKAYGVIDHNKDYIKKLTK